MSSAQALLPLLLALLLSTLPAAAQTGPDRGALAPGSALGLPAVGVDPIDPEEARQLNLEMLEASSLLLRVFDFGDPARQGALHAEIESLRLLLEQATPDELESLARFSGPGLRERHALAREQTALLIQTGLNSLSTGTEGRSQAKSAGFPELNPDLPEYPNISAANELVTVVTEPETLLADVEAWIGEGGSELINIPVCVGSLDSSTGRVRRLSNELVYLAETVYQISNIHAEVSSDFCGGASVDIVFSAGVSCDACCALITLRHGILTLIHDTQALCQDMIDTAEIEATWHAAKTTHEGVAHVHGDVEAVQRTADEILDIVTCRPVPELLRHHGCDGLDSDCDGTIDGCSEDAAAPELHVDEAVSGPWHASLEDATAALMRAVRASDDCREVSVSLESTGGACGEVFALVSAEDACGNRSLIETTLKVDGSAPTVSIPAGLESSCYPSIAAAEEAVLAAATLADDCTPASDLRVEVESTVTACTLRVRVSATDLAGHRTSDSVTVRVDTQGPELAIDRVALATLSPACFASVAEAEAAVLAVTRSSDNCSASSDLVPIVESSGDPCALRVRVSTTDDCGGTAEDDVELRVDSAAPVVTATVLIDELWPANHELIDVGLDYSALDDCDGEPQLRLSVSSDEPTESSDGAGGPSGPDAQLLRGPSGRVESVRLRAERSGSGNGRVYRISVEAEDPCGNVGLTSVEVRVPAQRRTTAVDDGQFYDATLSN